MHGKKKAERKSSSGGHPQGSSPSPSPTLVERPRGKASGRSGNGHNEYSDEKNRGRQMTHLDEPDVIDHSIKHKSLADSHNSIEVSQNKIQVTGSELMRQPIRSSDKDFYTDSTFGALND
jgi:hypothetical protein